MKYINNQNELIYQINKLNEINKIENKQTEHYEKIELRKQ